MSEQQPPGSGDAVPPEPPTAPPAYPSYPSYPAEDAGSGGGADDPGYGGHYDQPEPPASYQVGEAWTIGFRLFGKHAPAFLVLGVSAVLFTVGLSLVGVLIANGGSLTDSSGRFTYSTSFSTSETILQIVGGVIGTLLTAALVKGAFDAVDGRPVSIGGMFQGWDKLQVLLAAIIVNVLLTIGLVLLIIPGLIVLFLTWYANYFIVGSGKSALQAIGASVSFTANHIGPLLLTALLAGLTNLIGACLCGVGLFVSLPVTIIMAAVAFRQLQGHGVVTR